MHGQAASLRHTLSRRHNSGFTLMELIISIVLLGMLAAVGSSMIVDSFTTTRMVNADTASVGKARYALERLAREIREVKYASSQTSTPSYCDTPGTITDQYCITSPGTLTASPLAIGSVGSGNTLSFANATGTIITIARSGTDLTDLTLNGSILSDNVTGLTLTFFTAADETTTPTNSTVKFVVINLTVKDPTGGKGIQQRTRVALRNA